MNVKNDRDIGGPRGVKFGQVSIGDLPNVRGDLTTWEGKFGRAVGWSVISCGEDADFREQ